MSGDCRKAGVEPCLDEILTDPIVRLILRRDGIGIISDRSSTRSGVSLHPGKTRLIEFGRRAALRRAQRGLGKPETFDFLGFTFVRGKSRRGRFLVERKTRRDRKRAKLGEIKEEIRRRRHQPIPVQGK